MKRTTVWGMFYGGGGSYAAPYFPEDVEEFRSLTEAKAVFKRRVNGWERKFPCVGEDAQMVCVVSDPMVGDSKEFPYPDFILSVGPRGGIVVEGA